MTLLVYIPGGVEWLVILAVALLIFGKNLPQVGRSLGRGIVEFRKGLKGVSEDVENEVQDIDRLAKSDPPKLDATESSTSDSDHSTRR